jgi:hypothetical protein
MMTTRELVIRQRKGLWVATGQSLSGFQQVIPIFCSPFNPLGSSALLGCLPIVSYTIAMAGEYVTSCCLYSAVPNKSLWPFGPVGRTHYCGNSLPFTHIDSCQVLDPGTICNCKRAGYNIVYSYTLPSGNVP